MEARPSPFHGLQAGFSSWPSPDRRDCLSWGGALELEVGGEFEPLVICRLGWTPRKMAWPTLQSISVECHFSPAWTEKQSSLVGDTVSIFSED